MKIIENADIDDLQEGDIVDLHGLLYMYRDTPSGDLVIKIKSTGSDLVELIDIDCFNSLTIHRKEPSEITLEDAQTTIRQKEVEKTCQNCAFYSFDMDDAFCAHPKSFEAQPVFGLSLNAMHRENLCGFKERELWQPSQVIGGE